LDPGCGKGEFIDGVIRWCSHYGHCIPRTVGIESHPEHASAARDRFCEVPQVEIRHADFLTTSSERFDFVIGNPPYVPITGLTTSERDAYRKHYAAANRRFDLYLLFFEQALRLLRPTGRLVFITPEKFLYVDTGRAVRALLGRVGVEEFHFLDEETFGELVTYPLVSTVMTSADARPTRVIHRDGRVSLARLDGVASWLPAIRGAEEGAAGLSLADVCIRISCGVATGADSVFVIRDEQLDQDLRPFAHPTIAGRQIALGQPLSPRDRMLVPYGRDGRLLPEGALGRLGVYLSDATRRARLLARTCAARKPWYAFHETPPLAELLRPKLLCKDITETPFFVPDRTGQLVPRHSVYYVVPADPRSLDHVLDYLNSPPAQRWLRDHCQRAAKGFLRLQSHVLKRLPVPPGLAPLTLTAEPQYPLLEPSPT
jgi:SAM-dependent methyltransferase